METRMHTGNDDVLHRIDFGVVEPGIFWHVFPAAYLPSAANPDSKARLAWRDGAHSMFYAGDSAAAALWETALRHARVRGSSVYSDPVNFRGMMLARMTLKVAVPVIDLRPPYRRRTVDENSSLDALWDVVLKQPDHEHTHGVATRLMQQLANSGYPAGAALRWHSRQAGAESVLLFFEPPMTPSWWMVDGQDIFRLDAPDGQEQIRRALAAQQLHWVGAPAGSEFDPAPENISPANDGKDD